LRVRSPEIDIDLVAVIDEAGSLVLEGYDVGSNVEAILGDLDYEYWLTVPASELAKVLTCLESEIGTPNSDDEGAVGARLLQLLAEAFHSGRFTSDAQFRDWLTERGIESEFSSWI
jgi:hypothetical protein